MNQIVKSIKSFRRNPMLFFVNLPGLTVALAAFLLLMVYAVNELSYDQHFKTKDRVVRLYNTIIEGGTDETWAISLRTAYTELPQSVPEIEKAVQIYRGWDQTAKTDDKQLGNQYVYYVDPEFFDVFGLELMAGNKNDALVAANKMVITDELALKLFGDIQCVGQALKVDDEDFIINGVVKKMPRNTHLQFDILCSMKSISLEYMGGLEFFTYYLVDENADRKTLSQKITENNDIKLNALLGQFNAKGISGIVDLTQIHLNSQADFDLTTKGNKEQLIMVSFIAFFIMLIAIINFVNLYVYHGEKRLLEIGMRKTLGANTRSLRSLFYSETAIITLIALILAVLLASAAMPFFANLIGANININDLFAPKSVLLILLFTLLFIFLSASYPAHYLSGLAVTDAIKGGLKSIKRKKWLMVTSVMIQFFISSLLIVSLLVIGSQISYMKERPIGFNADQVVSVSGLDRRVYKNSDAILEELGKLNFVEKVATSDHFMGGGCSGQAIYVYGQTQESMKSINEYRVNPGFCEVMELDLVLGRFFRENKKDQYAVILNESAVEYFNIENPMESSVIMFDEKPLPIIGVVKDFVYSSHSGQKIQPLILTGYRGNISVFYLKIQGEYTQIKKNAIEKVMQSFLPDYQLSGSVLKQVYNNKYKQEERVFSIVSSGAILAIILSFIGMFALSVYMVEKRTKEIGIRKVNGSRSVQILLFLLLGILKWVLFAMIPAFLLAIILLDRLLSNFAYHISLSPWYFVGGAFISLLIATMAISLKSIQAARQNPIESLRYE